jgi:hypothetical protein
MGFCAYIGDANDPNFKWNGGDYNHNLPKRITPNLFNAYKIFNDKEFNFIKLDWGGFGAKVTKTQILNLLTKYGSSNELTESVQSLKDDLEYVLVIMETETEEYYYSEEKGEWVSIDDD